jgi:succinate-acetate transporter protein
MKYLIALVLLGLPLFSGLPHDATIGAAIGAPVGFLILALLFSFAAPHPVALQALAGIAGGVIGIVVGVIAWPITGHPFVLVAGAIEFVGFLGLFALCRMRFAEALF